MARAFENVSIDEPLPVIAIDEKAARFLEDAGGRIVDQQDFKFVWFPAGTSKKRIPMHKRACYIQLKAATTLYKLPSGILLSFSQHRLTFQQTLQLAS